MLHPQAGAAVRARFFRQLARNGLPQVGGGRGRASAGGRKGQARRLSPSLWRACLSTLSDRCQPLPLAPPLRCALRRSGRRSGSWSCARCRAAPTSQVRALVLCRPGGRMPGATSHPLTAPCCPAVPPCGAADVHVYTLASVLRRPIVVYADQAAAAAGLAGVYLPSLWPAGASLHCARQPLALLFGYSHFRWGGEKGGSPCLPVACLCEAAGRWGGTWRALGASPLFTAAHPPCCAQPAGDGGGGGPGQPAAAAVGHARRPAAASLPQRTGEEGRREPAGCALW